MSSWLRSRRFYAGLGIGLIPFVLLALVAAQSNGQRDALPSNDREQRVIVRNYGGCCPDQQQAERLREMIEQMPPDVVLIENFIGCCCGDTTRVTRGRAALAPSRGAAVPPRTWRDPQAALPEGVAADRMETPPPVLLPSTEAALPVPGGVPAAPAAAQPSRLLGLLAAPLLFLVGSTSGRPDPPGTICPDTGPPTGPDRPRC